MLTVFFDQWDLVRAHILHRGQQPGVGGTTQTRRAVVESFFEEVLATPLRLAEVVAAEASKPFTCAS